MPNTDVLWPMQDHTAAKHRLLRAFVDAWIPIVGQQEIKVNKAGPAVRIIDGFAGPGRYLGGEVGSPLILLKALVEHKALGRLSKAKFEYLFVEKHRDRHKILKENVGSFEIPGSIDVEIEIRAERFESVLEELNHRARAGYRPPPTFMFVDPFGYKMSGLTVTGNLLQFPRCEVLYFLPITQISRFVGTDGPSGAITSLYGSDEWKEAIEYEGQARRDFLGELFERKLEEQQGIEYARSLRLYTKDGNDYRLTFGVQHLKGLEIAKDALWQVDPIAGTSYRATGQLGQGTLFGLNAPFNPEELLSALRQRFGRNWFTIEEAQEATLVHTPFRLGQLKQATLAPAIEADRFDYKRASNRGLAPGSRLRFKE